ncbi:MAG: NAD-dependent oxidoreductase [Caulobacter sp.]|nr:NAD-dependent oxidoreductase [Caulobacter sp.]
MSGMVITGGFGVLGSGLADAALAQGWKVALIDFAPVPDARAAIGIGGVDLADPEAAAAAFATAHERLGGIDALVNVAGGFAWETVADGDLDTWDRLYRINVRSCLVASRAALPHLLQAGDARIVNVGANAATKAALGMGAYAASKSAVARLTESLAEELKGRVTVNAVLPSIIDTPTNRADMPDADHGAWVTPADLAAVILFLASPAARAVTGALVPVTGKV